MNIFVADLFIMVISLLISAVITPLAIEAKIFDHIIVSTEDEETAEVARENGAEVPFMRPDDLSDSYSRIEPVLRHTYEYLKEEELRREQK